MRLKSSFVFDSSKPVQATTPEAFHSILVEDFGYQSQEHFGVIVLNSSNIMLGVEVLTIGTVNQTPVDQKIIFQRILQKKKYNTAIGFVAFHNHPSGSFVASDEDIGLTRKIAAAAEIMGFRFLDHIIVAWNVTKSIRILHPEIFQEE
ncbi:MAG: JAB domain-containing protein [Bacteroidales bacterium]|nr:JAB domain-containing protein [Bacteroidales bacterium]